MAKHGKKRILLAKLGLDAHDNGIVIIAKWLSDAGFEVVYLGLYNYPELLIETAIQEDVDAIGCSFLGGEHLYYARELTALMKEKGLNHVKLIMGGVIPPEDIDKLKRLGVEKVFTPGALRDAIVTEVNDLFKGTGR